MNKVKSFGHWKFLRFFSKEKLFMYERVNLGAFLKARCKACFKAKRRVDKKQEMIGEVKIAMKISIYIFLGMLLTSNILKIEALEFCSSVKECVFFANKNIVSGLKTFDARLLTYKKIIGPLSLFWAVYSLPSLRMISELQYVKKNPEALERYAWIVLKGSWLQVFYPASIWKFLKSRREWF